MRVPIPDDWDGQSWNCFQIEWPDSPLWTAIFLGMLSYANRGRFWDERTGSILDVIAVGQEIYEKNFPFVDCSGEDVEQPEPEVIYKVISSMEGGIERATAMSLCGYNPKAFKIEEGKLFVRDFCGDWVEIGELKSEGDLPPTDIYDDADPPPQAYACGKVWNLINAFVALSNAAWFNYDNPTTFETAMRAAVPNVTMSRRRIYEWLTTIPFWEPFYEANNFSNPEMLQLAACRAVVDVKADTIATEGEVDAVITSLASAMSEVYGQSIAIEGWKSYWTFVMLTIGESDSRFLMELGATDDSQDCECPDIGGPTAGSIFFNGSQDGPGGGTLGVWGGGVTSGGRRWQVWLGGSEGSFRSATDYDLHLSGAVAGDYLTLRIYPDPSRGEFGYVGSKEWIDLDPPPAEADWLDLTIQGLSETPVRTEYDGYVEFQFSGDPSETALQVRVEDCRLMPESGSGGENMAVGFYIEITSVNGVDLGAIGP